MGNVKSEDDSHHQGFSFFTIEGVEPNYAPELMLSSEIFPMYPADHEYYRTHNLVHIKNSDQHITFYSDKTLYKSDPFVCLVYGYLVKSSDEFTIRIGNF